MKQHGSINEERRSALAKLSRTKFIEIQNATRRLPASLFYTGLPSFIKCLGQDQQVGRF
jgi:hypothetical protein